MTRFGRIVYGVPILTLRGHNMAYLQDNNSRRTDGPGGEPLWVTNEQAWATLNDPGEIHSHQFDYDHQAWVIDGYYVDCGHTVEHVCNCYGRRWMGYKAPSIH